jgi:signal peptidase II
MGVVALVVVLLDQLTKALVKAHFGGAHIADVVPVIGNYLTIIYDENTGAAFSSFTQSPVLLGFLILIACGVIGWLYWSLRSRNNPLLRVTFGMIIGGAIGNLIDRLHYGYVVDFVHFQLPSVHFDFAIFNVADAGISVGVLMLALIFWTLPRESEPALAPNAGSDAATPNDVGAPPTAANAKPTPATHSPITNSSASPYSIKASSKKRKQR